MNGETLTEQLSNVMSSSTLKIIEETPPILSLSQIQSIAKKAWSEEIQVTHFYIEAYSNEALGFLGSHKCLKISVRKKDMGEIETKSFFVKCIPQNNAILSNVLTELGVFEQEISFYTQVLPHLEQDYKAELWCPKCYMIINEVMVFEDLRSKNFSVRKKLLTKEETISALSTIARMHAASILTEKRMGKPLNELFPAAFNLKSYYHYEGPRLMWFRTGITLLISLAEYFGLDSSKIKECCETWPAAVKQSKDKQNVITHSDLWSNNIMFDNNSPPKCILVDYQMSRYCAIAQDVIIFLHLCTNRAFRKIYQTDMISHYYSVLTETLRHHNPEMKVPTWAELLQGIEENTPCAVSVAAMFFPAVLIDGKVCADLFSDPNSYWNFMYKDRRVQVLELINKDKEYADRVLEAVTELVEVSQKLDQYPAPS